MPVLMTLTILAIAAFQYYWLQKAYQREERTLEMRANIYFRETVRTMQAFKLKLDSIEDTNPSKVLLRYVKPDHKISGMIDIMMEKVTDSTPENLAGEEKNKIDTQRIYNKRDRLIKFLFDVDSMQDSITTRELDSAYVIRLEEQNLEVPFSISTIPTEGRDRRNEITLGFSNPITYRLDLGNTTGYLLKRISVPVLFSIFLLGFTILSFTVLYRNLLHQRRLANIKNEFISNITHELKTPIATVSVAIEALRSFNATLDAQRTKEYLDISANELQRLSLLVDKVLKLSMFEKKEIELKYESLDMKELVEEVTSSMRLQFEKHHAEVNVHSDGDPLLQGDRLHLVSVVFNLLDNALKYSAGPPKIDIHIRAAGDKLHMIISDSGIGIPAEYLNRIFEKFFRVPTGNLHNAKGYGLGLSYVAHVIKRHHGTIKAESVEGDGSRFIIILPKQIS